MEPKLGSLAQVHISVSDVEASVAFYRDVLGLSLLFTVPGHSMAFFDLGSGTRLYLGLPDPDIPPSRPILYYRVDDIRAAYAAVLERGAPPMAGPHVVHRDGVHELWVAFVTDPDGLMVGLMAEVPLAI